VSSTAVNAAPKVAGRGDKRDGKGKPSQNNDHRNRNGRQDNKRRAEERRRNQIEYTMRKGSGIVVEIKGLPNMAVAYWGGTQTRFVDHAGLAVHFTTVEEAKNMALDLQHRYSVVGATATVVNVKKKASAPTPGAEVSAETPAE
jgi:hypothetical protein